MGSDWSKDAFQQSELVLSACKLACKVLKKNGSFVTKIFRSSDYNSLIWVFEKLFAKVEAFKPEASRMQSAEIFVVCSGFKAPAKIDPRFFNSKFIFEQNESDVFDQMSGG